MQHTSNHHRPPSVEAGVSFKRKTLRSLQNSWLIFRKIISLLMQIPTVTFLLLFGPLRVRKTLARSLICSLVQLLALLSPIAESKAAAPPAPIPTPEPSPTQLPGTMPEIAAPSGPMSLAPSAEVFALSAVSIEGSTIFTEGLLEP